MSGLSTPLKCKSLTLKNRIVMPPMCQYSASRHDGMPTEWHYVHYVSRAVGGTGLIIMEMTNVEPDGRISNSCLGLWSDEHTPAFSRIIRECQSYGAKVAIQIAHAGRKAQDAPEPVAPSALAFDSSFKLPRALSTLEVKEMVQRFKAAVRRAVEAGVDTIELHGAHGYLIHQFHSPQLNQREDEYGRDLALFGIEVIRAAKEAMPADMPLVMRISAFEFSTGGYGLEHMLHIAARYKEAGVDLFHVSSGGEAPLEKHHQLASQAGYQLELARSFKEALGVPVIAVGLLEDPLLAEQAVATGAADLVAVGRGMLRDPYWAQHALLALAQQDELKGSSAAAEIVPPPYVRGY